MGLGVFALLIASMLQVPAAAPTATKAAGTNAPKLKIICVDQGVLGSRLGGRRVCRSAEDWARDQREVRDDVERAQRLAKMPDQ